MHFTLSITLSVGSANLQQLDLKETDPTVRFYLAGVLVRRAQLKFEATFSPFVKHLMQTSFPTDPNDPYIEAKAKAEAKFEQEVKEWEQMELELKNDLAAKKKVHQEALQTCQNAVGEEETKQRKIEAGRTLNDADKANAALEKKRQERAKAEAAASASAVAQAAAPGQL